MALGGCFTAGCAYTVAHGLCWDSWNSGWPVERSTAHELHGKAKLDYREKGLHGELIFPWKSLPRQESGRDVSHLGRARRSCKIRILVVEDELNGRPHPSRARESRVKMVNQAIVGCAQQPAIEQRPVGDVDTADLHQRRRHLRRQRRQRPSASRRRQRVECWCRAAWLWSFLIRLLRRLDSILSRRTAEALRADHFLRHSR
jgi:hypothetical protein